MLQHAAIPRTTKTCLQITLPLGWYLCIIHLQSVCMEICENSGFELVLGKYSTTQGVNSNCVG